MSSENDNAHKLRVVVTIRADVSPELWSDLKNVSTYGRSERLRTLATIGAQAAHHGLSPHSVANAERVESKPAFSGMGGQVLSGLGDSEDSAW